MRLSLARLTLLVWLAWLVTWIGIVSLSYARVFHPSFLYMAIPVAVQMLATVAVLLGGTWRIIRGPRRWRAATWMLFSILPVLWTAAYNAYSAAFVTGTNQTPNPLIRSSVAVVPLMLEWHARAHYPYRHEGERFVMWSDSPECDPKQMAAMDAHLRAMEQSLDQHSQYKVYWVRGPVWGLDGRYVFGWAVGSDSATLPDDDDGLNYMDRHEVAHFALDQLLPDNLETPRVLKDGWAELHSGRLHSATDWRQSWIARQESKWLSLRELTNPQRYHSSDGPVYWQGCVLVDYLLRRFGHQKFLELCRTCRQATFPDDVQRVLGLNVDALDQAYQQDLVEHGPPDRRFLLSAKLGDGVDPAGWRRFVDDYCAGVQRMRTSFRQSSVTMIQTHERVDKGGKKETFHFRFEYHRDNRREASIDHLSKIATTQVVTPDYTFWLNKQKTDQPWQMTYYLARDPKGTYDLAITSRDDPWFLHYCLDPLQQPQHCVTGLTITAIQSSTPNSPRIRVSYERTVSGLGDESRERGWWDLDPQRDYGVVEAKCENLGKAGAPVDPTHTTVQYEAIEGKQVPKLVQREFHSSDGTSGHTIGKIESCRFEAPPAKVFELAAYGDLHPKPPASKPPKRLGSQLGIASVCSLLALLMALGQLLFSRRPTGHQSPATDHQPPATSLC